MIQQIVYHIRLYTVSTPYPSITPHKPDNKLILVFAGFPNGKRVTVKTFITTLILPSNTYQFLNLPPLFDIILPHNSQIGIKLTPLMNYSSLTIFTLFILCFTTYLHVSAELTGYPYPISSIQKQIVLTGIWEIDVTKLTTTAPVSISFEYKPPQSTTKISPVNAILQIYQRELLLIDTPIKLGRDKNSLTFDVHFDQTAFSRLDPAHNIHYYLQYDLTDSPTQAGMVDNSNISSCLEIKQSTISPSAQQCFPHPITASALKPIDISNTQTSFRAYCNGQTPPAPMELTNNNINNNTTPCDIVDRFHINAYGLALTTTTTTTTKPTLTFQIAGHAIIRSKSGIFHPQQISCRVNTHYVTFYRADNIPAEFGDTTFFPSQKNIYVAYDVTELYNEGVL